MAGIDAGDELGGNQSSATIEVIRNSGKSCGAGLLKHLRDGLKLLVASGELPATSYSGGPRRASVELGLEEEIEGESLGKSLLGSRGVQWKA